MGKLYLLFLYCLIFVSCEPKDGQNNQKEKPNQECVEPESKNPPPDSYCIAYPSLYQIDDEAVGNAALVFDADSKMHIVYRVITDSDKRYLRYANNVSGIWQVTTFNFEVSDFDYDDLNIFVDSAGKAHIIFSDCLFDASSVCHLKYLANSSGKWILETIQEEGDVLLVFFEACQFTDLSIFVDDKNIVHLSHVSQRFNGPDSYAEYFLLHSKRSKTDLGNKWQSEIIIDAIGLESEKVYIAASPLVIDSAGDLHLMAKYNNSIGDGKEYFSHFENDGKSWQEEKIANEFCNGIDGFMIDQDDNLYFVYEGEDVDGKDALYFGSNKNSGWQFENVYQEISDEMEWGPMELSIRDNKVYIFIGGIIGFDENQCFAPDMFWPEYGYGYAILLVKNDDIWTKHYLPNIGTCHSYFTQYGFEINNAGVSYLLINDTGIRDIFPEDYDIEPLKCIKGLYYYSFSENDPANLCANVENIETCCGCTDFSEKCVLDHNQWDCYGECLERYTWVSSWQWPEEKFIEEAAQYQEIMPEQICVADCTGKDCGNDGCGGSCGSCLSEHECVDGKCECIPNCQNKECGDDGCGGGCGECYGQDECINGQCICQPDCCWKQCGDNGCGDNCGECHIDSEICQYGRCILNDDNYIDICSNFLQCLSGCPHNSQGIQKEECALECVYNDGDAGMTFSACFNNDECWIMFGCVFTECSDIEDISVRKKCVLDECTEYINACLD